MKTRERHGLSQSAEYRILRLMIGRCHEPSNGSYHKYGAKGITVCPAWRDSFIAFYQHIGPRPTSRHTIDRIDGTKGYEPGNVRWATYSEQNLNKELSRRNTSGYRGVTWLPKKQRYIAQVSAYKQPLYIGCYADIQEAAYMYDQYALVLHGDFARTNFEYTL